MFYLDNQAERVTLLQMKSDSPALELLASVCGVLKAEMQCLPWRGRVPSKSNPADAPSGLCFEGLDESLRVSDDNAQQAVLGVIHTVTESIPSLDLEREIPVHQTFRRTGVNYVTNAFARPWNQECPCLQLYQDKNNLVKRYFA